MFLYMLILLLIKGDHCRRSAIRSYNGYIVIDNQYPFVVSIEEKVKTGYKVHCLGSLFDEYWLLTSASCIKCKNFTVPFGDKSTKENIARVDVVKQVSHPDYYIIDSYKNWTAINNIGLMKVDRIPLETVAQLSYIDYKEFTNLIVVYAGYGKTMEDEGLLLLGEGIISDCSSAMDIVHTGICVATNTTNVLNAYSGSPLLHNGTIIGINSGLSDYEMLFVSLNTYYIKWMHSVLYGDVQESTIKINLEVALPLPKPIKHTGKLV